MSGLDILLLVSEVTVLLANDHHIPLRWSPGTLPASNDNLSVTGNQRVSSESLLAPADGSVVPDLTVGVLATGANTGISAVVVKACQAVRTLMVILTFSLPTITKIETCKISSSFLQTCS